MNSILAPFFISPVAAGFPSPADDYIDQHLDLNEYLIKHPAATFFVRVEGNSMINAGIYSGDILIVDRALEPRDNNIVISSIDGGFTVKRLKKNGKKLYLMAENTAFKPIEINEGQEVEVWGVVTTVIHQIK